MPPAHCEDSKKDRTRSNNVKIKKEDGGLKKKKIKKEYEMEREIKKELKEKRKRIKKEVKTEDGTYLKSVKKEVNEGELMKIIPISDPDIPDPWRAHLSRKRMRIYYFNRETGESTWEREVVENWKRIHKRYGISKPPQIAPNMTSCSYDDIQIIKEIREAKHVAPPSTSCKPSGHLNFSSDSIAVFDTSALIELPEIVRIAKKHDATVVIPYKVVQELDGLKKSERNNVVHAAIKVHHILDHLSSNNNPLLILESGREANEPLEGFPVECADDMILKCALVVEKFMSSRGMRHISFVTNDANLRLKTRGFNTSLQAVESQEFVNGLVKRWNEKKERKMKEIKESPSVKNEKEVKRKEKNQGNANFIDKIPPIESKRKIGIAQNLLKDILSHPKMGTPSTSKDEVIESVKKNGETEVVEIEEEDDDIQIIDPSSPMKKDEDEWDDPYDGIIEIDIPRPPIPDEIWDEYRKPAEVLQMVLAETPSAIYSEFNNRFNNVLIRRKAFDDLSLINKGMNDLLGWNWNDPSIEGGIMELYHLLHSLHQYYRMRKPFPPQYLDKSLLSSDLRTYPTVTVKNWVKDSHDHISNFGRPVDFEIFL